MCAVYYAIEYSLFFETQFQNVIYTLREFIL